MAGRRLRLRVLLLVGKGQMQCTKCGCNKPGLLEINHINGGGSKEYHAAGGSGGMYRAIANLEPLTEDLELLCKVCNARHYLELRHGALPYAIRWLSKAGVVQ